jgi:hypothetical protein
MPGNGVIVGREADSVPATIVAIWSVSVVGVNAEELFEHAVNVLVIRTMKIDREQLGVFILSSSNQTVQPISFTQRSRVAGSTRSIV